MSIILCNDGKIIQKVSQEETQENSENLISFLQKHIFKKSRILLFMGHNVHIPAIVLGLKMLGHVYIPINMNANSVEFTELIEETKIEYILCFFETHELFKNFDIKGDLTLFHEKIVLWKNKIEFSFIDNFDTPVLCIIPTSGTTGEKKLISIGTYCIQKNVESLSSIFDLTKDDVIFFGTPLTFDPSLVELFMALETGATLLIIPENIKLNYRNLFQTLFPSLSEYPKVTFIQMVSSLFTRWSEKQIKYILNESQLRILALGGEIFPIEILKFKRNLRLYNLYGVTEVSCWATIHEIQEDNRVFLGDVLDETFVKVFENGVEIQEGIGELYIGSESRMCYVNGGIEKMRSTGDVVQKTAEGLLYIGRKNNLIKRLGNRIFLEDIERKIREQTELRSKCLFLQKSSVLLLFILIETIHQEDKTRILDKFRVKLRHILQKEEYPDFLEIISIFPVTANGKIDTKTLIQIYEHNKIKQKNEKLSDLFRTLITEYLGLSSSNFDSYKNYNFFQLGGNSILYNLLVNNLKDNANGDLPQEFSSLLFDESIENCANFLEKIHRIPCKKLKLNETDVEMKRKNRYKNCEIFWKYDLHGCVDASPLVFLKNDEIFVAVGSFANFFTILNGETGQPRFEEIFQDSIGSKATVSKCLNYVYIGCFDGNIICINVDSNCIAWKYKSEDAIKCTPNFCRNNEALVFGSYDKHLHCINAKTGKFIWKINIQESIVTTPFIHELTHQIIVTTLIGSCISISEENGNKNWCLELNNPIFSSSFNVNDNLFFVDVRGRINNVDITTGKQIFNISIEDEVYSAVTLIENFLIIGSQKGFLYKCELISDLSNCVIRNKIDLNESISAAPLIFQYKSEDIIIVITIHGFLYLIKFTTMDIISYWKCPGDIFSSPFLHENKLYVGCRDDYLYCLNIYSLLD